MTPVPDFPSELVEAAAKALAGEWHMVSKDLRARWDSVLPDDNPGVPENWLARAVLATVVPLIEQRVVERLAKQAGTNPYADADSVDFDPYMRDGWFEGAACGVAAERARIWRLIATLYDGPPAQHPVIVEILEALEDK